MGKMSIIFWSCRIIGARWETILVCSDKMLSGKRMMDDRRRVDIVSDFVKKLLQDYDKAVLVTRFFPREEWSRFCTALSTVAESLADKGIVFLVEEGLECPEVFQSKVLPHKEAEELYKQYLTYEFSDRFSVFSDNMQYGTIFNYVHTGILTEEEAVRAVLG